MTIRPITAADIPALSHVRPRTRENALTLAQLRVLGIAPASVPGFVATQLVGAGLGVLISRGLDE